MEQNDSRVQLLVYDLSRGMAATMSQQILGQRIDGIWHTGIQIFGVEYFFGGGIQSSPAGIFARQHQMPPVRILELGQTQKSQTELRAFLQSIHNRFNAATYDLTRNNCNNFSDTVSQFLVGQRIPSYIVDLPNIVFNTPGGQMLRPMIENMQNAVYSQPSSGVNATYSQSENSDGRSLQNSASIQANTPANIEDKQLVSSDNQTVNALGNKILNLKSTLKNADGTSQESSALSEEKKAVINKIMQAVMNATDSIAEGASGNIFTEDACNTLSSVISDFPQLQMSSLFLMRLLVLKEKLLFSGSISAVATMIESLLSRLSAAQGTTEGFSSVPSTVMGLCTVANILSHPSGQIFVFDSAEIAGSVVDIAVSALSNTRVEVRQMGATVAYNFTFSFNESMLVHRSGGASRLILSGDGELNPLAVQLFCGAMEAISSEREVAVRYRRLCVALRIVRMGGSGAKSLGRDLGFGSDIAAISPSSVLETQVLGELRRAFAT